MATEQGGFAQFGAGRLCTVRLISIHVCGVYYAELLLVAHLCGIYYADLTTRSSNV